jgi:hypothetical protein
MMWLGGQHMSHEGMDDRRWSSGDRAAMGGMIAGYVLVKLVAGLHAGYAAQSFNRRYDPRWSALVTPSRGGALAGWQARF